MAQLICESCYVVIASYPCPYCHYEQKKPREPWEEDLEKLKKTIGRCVAAFASAGSALLHAFHRLRDALMKLIATLTPDLNGGDTNKAWASWNGGSLRLLQFYERGKEPPLPLNKKVTVTVEVEDDE